MQMRSLCLELWLLALCFILAQATAWAGTVRPVVGTAACIHAGMPSVTAASSQARAVAWLDALRKAKIDLPHGLQLSAAYPLGLTACLYELSSFTSCTDTNRAAEVHLTPRADRQGALSLALRNPELPALYGRLAEETKALLLKLQAVMRYGRANDNPVTKTVLCRQLDGLWLALSCIQSGPEGWLCDGEDRAKLSEAARLAPQSPSVHLLLAETQLQHNLPLECVASCDIALRISPDLGRALYVRALAHWRLHQLALAETDLNAALQITLIPPPHGQEQIRRLRARGAVRMLRGHYDAMCEDFTSACGLGDCEGLAEARQRGHCRPSKNMEKP